MQAKAKKVLLFDDDYESMLPLKQYLEGALNLHVELTAAKTLLERLADEQFDLICVDLMIHPVSPDAEGNEVQNVHFDHVNWQKTGLEFLRHLRRGAFCREPGQGTSSLVPVIVLSAIANYSVEDELGPEIPVQGYVEKPFALEEIIEQISQLLQVSSGT